MRIWLLLIILFLCVACTNDTIIQKNKAGFTDIYRNILLRGLNTSNEKVSASKTLYNKKWLSKFKQPIIGLSSPGKTEKATLVMLGNQNDKLTWVSADGISVSFANGILIATRGYSQDLMESRHSDLDNIFTKDTRNHSKIFRYLNGQNEYVDHNFSCSVVTSPNTSLAIVGFNLKTTKFTESCSANSLRHINEYYVLTDTNIVLKSKQWISKANGYINVYNYYAFQSNQL